MVVEESDIVDQAIRWHLRQPEMTSAEWRAFTLWLEEPAHAAAFDSVVLDQGLLDMPAREQVAPIAPAVGAEAAAPRARKPWWIGIGGGLVAACLLAAVTVHMTGRPDYYIITTRPGVHQSVTLQDGTWIEINGGTTLKLDHKDSRFAGLESGEAVFHVRHDAHNPFTLHSGDIRIRDLGTVFNVARDGFRVDLQVAEGSVLFQPDREALTLKAGSALVFFEDRKQEVISRVDPGVVGAWRTGRLSFSATPLAEVVRVLERQSGIHLVVDPALASRPFTGMVHLTGSAAVDVVHFATLVGARASRNGDHWILEPAEHAAP